MFKQCLKISTIQSRDGSDWHGTRSPGKKFRRL